MEVVDVAKLMKRLIDALRDEGHRSEGLVQAKAEAICCYDKAMGIATTTLKATGSPATLIGSLAKAECAEVLRAKIVAEETLKAHYSRIEILKAQLNGYQSINR